MIVVRKNADTSKTEVTLGGYPARLMLDLAAAISAVRTQIADSEIDMDEFESALQEIIKPDAGFWNVEQKIKHEQNNCI
nr:MAG TPA: hypothetical protein [Caudoviricetes sp.]